MINVGAIIRLESSWRSDVVNAATGATGLMQITKICLDDYNQVHKTYLTMEDMKKGGANVMVGTWYLNKRLPQLLHAKGIPAVDALVLIAFNGGCGNAAKVWGHIPSDFQDYLLQYYAAETYYA